MTDVHAHLALEEARPGQAGQHHAHHDHEQPGDDLERAAVIEELAAEETEPGPGERERAREAATKHEVAMVTRRVSPPISAYATPDTYDR